VRTVFGRQRPASCEPSGLDPARPRRPPASRRTPMSSRSLPVRPIQMFVYWRKRFPRETACVTEVIQPFSAPMRRKQGTLDA
jgi:hypothetical protein